LRQQFVDLLRVGLALGGFHRLTDQRIEGLFLAGPEFRDHCCIGRQHIVDQRLDGAAVGDLLQALLVDDFVGRSCLRRSTARRTPFWRCCWRSCCRRCAPPGRRVVRRSPAMSPISLPSLFRRAARSTMTQLAQGLALLFRQRRRRLEEIGNFKRGGQGLVAS
jgi:hypothetical protein